MNVICSDSSPQEHLNVRAALIHVLGDLIQSVGVLISSILIKIDPGLKMADPGNIWSYFEFDISF